MTPTGLKLLLDQLIAAWENEVVEFKQAGSDYDTDKIGEYFSALSNEANLRGVQRAWLVFGINDMTRAIVGHGSLHRGSQQKNRDLKRDFSFFSKISST